MNYLPEFPIFQLVIFARYLQSFSFPIYQLTAFIQQHWVPAWELALQNHKVSALQDIRQMIDE